MLEIEFEKLHDELLRTGEFQNIIIRPSERPIGFRFYKFTVDITATFDDITITVTGESNDQATAIAKARSEFYERHSFLTLPFSNKFLTSNGFAAHPNLAEAGRNAVYELIERDAVLSQWLSSVPFLKISNKTLPESTQRWADDELARSEFPELHILVSTQGLGTSVSCLLTNATGFGVSGHATRKTLQESIESAIGEACRAAHASIRREYWQDSLKLDANDAGLVGPGAHSVYYSYHRPFPDWVVGSLINFENAEQSWKKSMSLLEENLRKFEVQEVTCAPVHVCFARHPTVFELYWGKTNPELIKTAGARRLGINVINTQPHITS